MSRCHFHIRVGICVITAGLIFEPPHRPIRADSEPKPKEIKLSDVFSTSIQEGLNDLVGNLAEDSPERRSYSQIRHTLRERKSQPCIAIARGDTIQEAVTAAARWIEAKAPAGEIFGPDAKSKSKEYWLFVYINHTSSTPPMWLIQPPVISGSKVRFTYTRPDGNSDQTNDHSPYLYLAPLGEFADPAELEAELVFLEKSVRARFSAK
jgi:hypothetical protein